MAKAIERFWRCGTREEKFMWSEVPGGRSVIWIESGLKRVKQDRKMNEEAVAICQIKRGDWVILTQCQQLQGGKVPWGEEKQWGPQDHTPECQPGQWDAKDIHHWKWRLGMWAWKKSGGLLFTWSLPYLMNWVWKKWPHIDKWVVGNRCFR